MLTTLIATTALLGPVSSTAGVKPLIVSPLRTAFGLKGIAYAAAPRGSKFAASLENSTIREIDANTGKDVKSYKGLFQPAYAVSYSPDGKWLASGDESGRVWLWDTATAKRIKEFPRSGGHIRGVQAVSFNPKGTLIASTGKDDVIIVWDIATGKQSTKILGAGVNLYSGTFLSDTLLASGSLGKGLTFYETKSWQPVKSIDGHSRQGALDLAFSSISGRLLTAGKDGSAVLYSVKNKSALSTMKGHEDWVLRCAFSPNGKLAATSSSDRTVRIWSTDSFKQVAVLNTQSSVGAPLCFTADGRYLITAGASDDVQVNVISPPQGTTRVKDRIDPRKLKAKKPIKRKAVRRKR